MDESDSNTTSNENNKLKKYSVVTNHTYKILKIKTKAHTHQDIYSTKRCPADQ